MALANAMQHLMIDTEGPEDDLTDEDIWDDNPFHFHAAFGPEQRQDDPVEAHHANYFSWKKRVEKKYRGAQRSTTTLDEQSDSEDATVTYTEAPDEPLTKPELREVVARLMLCSTNLEILAKLHQEEEYQKVLTKAEKTAGKKFKTPKPKRIPLFAGTDCSTPIASPVPSPKLPDRPILNFKLNPFSTKLMEKLRSNGFWLPEDMVMANVLKQYKEQGLADKESGKGEWTRRGTLGSLMRDELNRDLTRASQLLFQNGTPTKVSTQVCTAYHDEFLRRLHSRVVFLAHSIQATPGSTPSSSPSLKPKASPKSPQVTGGTSIGASTEAHISAIYGALESGWRARQSSAATRSRKPEGPVPVLVTQSDWQMTLFEFFEANKAGKKSAYTKLTQDVVNAGKTAPDGSRLGRSGSSMSKIDPKYPEEGDTVGKGERLARLWSSDHSPERNPYGEEEEEVEGDPMDTFDSVYIHVTPSAQGRGIPSPERDVAVTQSLGVDPARSKATKIKNKDKMYKKLLMHAIDKDPIQKFQPKMNTDKKRLSRSCKLAEEEGGYMAGEEFKEYIGSLHRAASEKADFRATMTQDLLDAGAPPEVAAAVAARYEKAMTSNATETLLTRQDVDDEYDARSEDSRDLLQAWHQRTSNPEHPGYRGSGGGSPFRDPKFARGYEIGYKTEKVDLTQTLMSSTFSPEHLGDSSGYMPARSELSYSDDESTGRDLSPPPQPTPVKKKKVVKKKKRMPKIGQSRSVTVRPDVSAIYGSATPTRFTPKQKPASSRPGEWSGGPQPDSPRSTESSDSVRNCTVGVSNSAILDIDPSSDESEPDMRPPSAGGRPTSASSHNSAYLTPTMAYSLSDAPERPKLAKPMRKRGTRPTATPVLEQRSVRSSNSTSSMGRHSQCKGNGRSSLLQGQGAWYKQEVVSSRVRSKVGTFGTSSRFDEDAAMPLIKFGRKKPTTREYKPVNELVKSGKVKVISADNGDFSSSSDESD